VQRRGDLARPPLQAGDHEDGPAGTAREVGDTSHIRRKDRIAERAWLAVAVVQCSPDQRLSTLPVPDEDVVVLDVRGSKRARRHGPRGLRGRRGRADRHPEDDSGEPKEPHPSNVDLEAHRRWDPKSGFSRANVVRFDEARVREEIAQVDAASDATELFARVALGEELVEFLTVPAYDLLP
jgi:hypothetical protein